MADPGVTSQDNTPARNLWDSDYWRYHCGEETPLRQWLYDDIGVNDLARCERDPLAGFLTTDALMAKIDRLVCLGIFTAESAGGAA